MTNNTIIEVENLTKIYHRGTEEIRAVDNTTFSIEKGEYISVSGNSGSGKSTLLNMIGCLDRPTSGKITVDNHVTSGASEKELTLMRKKSIGFVFQQFFLIPTLTVQENVEVPALFATHREEKERAKELLETVGLSKRLNHLPSQLSGGEMQRVAVARSLINKPPILLADEPTGSLDTKNAHIIMDLFEVLNKKGITIIMVSHNMELANKCSRMIKIKDGKIES